VAARTSLTSRSMRRIRVSASLTRWVVYATATMGLAASARYAIAPPHPPAVRSIAVDHRDLASEGFASLLARRYLTFDGDRPEAHRAQLAPFVGDQLDPDLGLRPPPGRAQRVQWAQVVQMRRGPGGSLVYTVASQTDRAGLLYLSIDVARGGDGALRVVGYPALVGAPLTGKASAEAGGRLRELADDGLRATCQRALRNYLARASDNLAADLSPDATVALPGLQLMLRRLTDLLWAPDDASVLATVEAADSDGVAYTLRYELDVRRIDERWEIAAIQMDPTK
jgi:Conjugative transposon protein TcpC